MSSKNYKSSNKAVFWFLILMFVLTSLPVWTIFANEARMWGPLPMVLTWSYIGYFFIMLAVIWIYKKEFEPWSREFELRFEKNEAVPPSPAELSSKKGGVKV